LNARAFVRCATATYCDVLTRERVMDMVGMRPLWSPIPRIASPAYPLRNEPGDNRMLHIAIYRAPAGPVIVCLASDNDYAQTRGGAVAPADMVIAGEEGIGVLPSANAEEILKVAQARAEKDASTSLGGWVAAHKKTIDDLVKKLGIDG
jgi:regulator of RNase E activity RraA